MKKRLLLAASAFACGWMLTNCSGGTSINTNSGVIENEYLGAFPRIHADYELAESELRKKAEEEMAKYSHGSNSDYSKLQKLSQKYEAQEKEMQEKFEADLAAESQKFVGKKVPFSYSDLLKSSNDLFYEITNVKTALSDKGEPILVFNLKANKDFTVPKYSYLNYTIYIRMIDKDKNTLENGSGVIIPIASNLEAVSFKAGDVFPEQTRPVSVNIPNRAYFAGIEFLSNDEYKKLIGL